MQEQFIVNYFTLGLFFIVSIIFVPAMIFLTRFLVPHNPINEKLATYKCGAPPRVNYSICIFSRICMDPLPV